MRRILYFFLLAVLASAPSTVLASECGRPVSKALTPRAVDSLYILQAAVGSRHCRLEHCDIDSDCRITVSDALGTLRSSVGDDLVYLDCKSECPTTVRCGAEDAPMCNGVCPAEQACMPVDDDGEDYDDRVTICHLPWGNPRNAHTLVVGEASISAHLRHGDELGSCEGLGILARDRDGGDDSDSDSDSDSDDSHGDNGEGGGDCGQGGTTGSSATGQMIYDTRCQFCHAAGVHDTTPGSGGEIIGEGSDLRNDLGAVDSKMAGIILTDQELAHLVAFLDSCDRSTTTTTMLPTTTTTMEPPPTDAECICVPVAVTTSTTMVSATTTTTVAPATTTTTTGPSIAAGQAIYDAGCQFCHGAGAHDPTNDPAGDLARRGSRLRNDLGSIDGQMQGLTLTDQELANLAAFLDSL